LIVEGQGTMRVPARYRSMKLRKSILASTVLSISYFLSGCGNDPKPEVAPDEAAPPEEVPAVVEPADDDTPKTVVAPADLSTRAELMGFARFVPKDFQTFVSFRPQFLHGRLKDTRIFEWMTSDLDTGLDDGPLDFFEDCEEVFITTGNTTAKQTDVLYQISSEISQLMYLELYEKLAIQSGMMAPEDARTGEFNQAFDAFPEEFRKNFNAHVDLLDAAQMPMIIVAARFRDKTEQIEEVLAQMEKDIMDGPESPLEVIELDRGPNEKLLAFKLKFSNILDKESFLRSVEDLELTDAQFERLYEVFSTKAIVFGFGKKEGYLVFFAGESVDQLEFAKSLDESLVAAEDSAFFERYAEKPVVYQQMASEAFTTDYSKLSMRTLQNYINPARDVLDRIDLLGDKRDLMAMLDGIESMGNEVYRMQGGSMVGAGYLEDGFKLEVQGGLALALSDFSSPSRFAALAEDPSFVLVWSSNITQEGKMNLLEVEQLLGEFAGAMSDRYFALDLADEEQAEIYKFYSTTLAADLRKVWTAIKEEWVVGLGNEGVLVMDTKGSMPKFPMIPSAFATDAKIPRMALMYPVTDRERLQKSWADIEPSLRSVIEAISKKADAGFTLPDPSVTKSDDLSVYSYPVTGFTNDDFLPCLAVSDGYLVISSSKVFAMELIEKMNSGDVKESPGGQLIDMNFSTLREYGRDLVDVTKKHETLLADDEVMMDWLDGIDAVDKMLDGMEFVDRIRYSTTADSTGKLSTLLHLQFKDIPEAAYQRIKQGDTPSDVPPEPPFPGSVPELELDE